MIVHAGLIALHTGGRWRGVLISGPAGVGKSDLALRALDQGFRLVADDRTRLFADQGQLYGRAPGPLAGLIEARGLGVLRRMALPFAPVVLSVRCKTAAEAVERLPEPNSERRLDVEVPVLELRPLENSALAKMRSAIEYLGARS
jgi:serine kinase of HPr protein (carbohydrate metabolism regulator)